MRSLFPTALIAVLVSMLLHACSDAPPPPDADEAVGPVTAGTPAVPAADRTGVVTETAAASGYTYVHVDTGDGTFWAAAPQFAVSVGDTVVVPEGMAMPNFHSSTLDRDFDVVYFVAAVQVGTDAPAPTAGRMPAGHPPLGGAAPAPAVDPSGVEPPADGQRVGEIVGDPAAFAGRSVAVRGQVVKVNTAILGKNWLHIQDGSGEPGKDDLTVTTDALARVGDTVVVRGVVSVDRDFGFGYAYEVLIEDARVTVE